MSIKACKSPRLCWKNALNLSHVTGAGMLTSCLRLLPTEADPVSEERHDKGNPGRPHSSIGSKIVLTLLTEVVAVHVGLFAVYVQRTGLQLFLGSLGDDGSWSGSGSGGGSLSFQNGLKNPLQVILGILGDISNSNKGVNKGGFYLWGSGGLVGQFVTWLGR